MRNRWFGPACILAMLGFSVAVYNQLPAQVPTHWGISGEVDQWSDKTFAAFFMPILCVGLWLLLLFLPRFDPRREAYKAFDGTYRLISGAIMLTLIMLHIVLLGSGLGWDLPIPRVVTVIVGALLAVTGNELGRVQPNWFVGIRTPWTLADPEVWRRTHRLGGRVLFASGLLIALSGLLLPSVYAFAAVLLFALGSTGFLVVYSYMLWRQGHAS